MVRVLLLACVAIAAAEKLHNCDDLNLDAFFDGIDRMASLAPCMTDAGVTDFAFLASSAPLSGEQWAAFFDSASCRALYNNLSATIYDNPKMPKCQLDASGTTRRDLAKWNFDTLRNYMLHDIIPRLLSMIQRLVVPLLLLALAVVAASGEKVHRCEDVDWHELQNSLVALTKDPSVAACMADAPLRGIAKLNAPTLTALLNSPACETLYAKLAVVYNSDKLPVCMLDKADTRYKNLGSWSFAQFKELYGALVERLPAK
ncbi:hypothetical protein SDRG_14574 [Saprolegnia diclina VS20]|uniref:Secreted protein n=1 Tax=Saprolegnia diclina (strain VS20) TaxID=1156394 RepID=T0PZH6_SAPDV|nr:hypothetical protein SDRG_14574 [Saprolegnia diclina VS20]EQC27666.1 hypothetical protein SDRG_14574 [Saprolegnia diclina VS20]|eukprot:XP_008618934.1 hypothetical protein SDRG_14574 [Saprolegnia diclina VS20]